MPDSKATKKQTPLRAAAQSQPELYQSILDCAETLFHTLGYQKVTVGDIAKTLKMSPANIYRFFSSKAQLRESLAARLTSELEGACVKAMQSSGTPSERLTRMIVTHHQMTVERFIANSNVLEMLSDAMRENWSVVQSHMERTCSLFEAVIEDGVKAGEFSVSDRKLAARLVLNSIAVYIDPSEILLQQGAIPDGEVEAMCRFIVGALASGNI